MQNKDNSEENGARVAKLPIDQNSCTLDDVEICERGVDTIWDVNNSGEATNYIETWSGEGYYAYYHCRECGELWEIDKDNTQGQEKAWKEVKEHLNEN